MNNKSTIFVIGSILLDCFVGFMVVGLILSNSAKSDKIAELHAQNSSLLVTNSYLSDSITEKDNAYARLEEKYREKIQECNDEYEKNCALWRDSQEYIYTIYELEDKVVELENELSESTTSNEVICESLSEGTANGSIFMRNAYNIELSNEDFRYLCRCVETETHGCPVENKMNVASVILNRATTGWGKSVKDVITSPNQFAYKRTMNEVSLSTIDAILLVLQYGDTTEGALYFHSSKYPVGYFSKYNAEYMFTDEVGHSFYK